MTRVKRCPACDELSEVCYRCEHCGKDLADTSAEEVARHV